MRARWARSVDVGVHRENLNIFRIGAVHVVQDWNTREYNTNGAWPRVLFLSTFFLTGLHLDSYDGKTEPTSETLDLSAGDKYALLGKLGKRGFPFKSVLDLDKIILPCHLINKAHWVRLFICACHLQHCHEIMHVRVVTGNCHHVRLFLNIFCRARRNDAPDSHTLSIRTPQSAQRSSCQSLNAYGLMILRSCDAT